MVYGATIWMRDRRQTRSACRGDVNAADVAWRWQV